jgi:hypothetical protein
MVSSSERVVRGSLAAKGTRQPVWRTPGFAIGAPNAAAILTGRASDLCWREAKRPVSAAVWSCEVVRQHDGVPMAEPFRRRQG